MAKLSFDTDPLHKDDLHAEDSGQAYIATLYPPGEEKEDEDGIFIRVQSWHEGLPTEGLDRFGTIKHNPQALNAWHPKLATVIQPGKRYRVTIEEITK